MVNLEHKYYIDNPNLRCPKNIKPTELNSMHPYWSRVVKAKTISFYKKKRNQAKECIKDPKKTKYLFNAGADVYRILEEARNKIKTP